MNDSRALVVTYYGYELPESVIKEIAKSVFNHGCEVKISTFAGDDIRKALALSTNTDLYKISRLEKSWIDKQPKKSEEQMAIESAVIYIGEKFAEWLTGPQKSMPVFLTQLSARLTYAKMYGNDDNLIKAVNILCTHTGKIPAKLSKKYGFNDVVLATIKTADVSDFHF